MLLKHSSSSFSQFSPALFREHKLKIFFLEFLIQTSGNRYQAGRIFHRNLFAIKVLNILQIDNIAPMRLEKGWVLQQHVLNICQRITRSNTASVLHIEHVASTLSTNFFTVINNTPRADAMTRARRYWTVIRKFRLLQIGILNRQQQSLKQKPRSCPSLLSCLKKQLKRSLEKWIMK